MNSARTAGNAAFRGLAAEVAAGRLAAARMLAVVAAAAAGRLL